MIKKAVFVILLLLMIIGIYSLSTGFVRRNDVCLVDYEVYSDGKDEYIILKCSVPTSMGYIRDMTVDGGGVKSYYLSFYSTFGGINSSLGAENTFTLQSNYETEIYFKRSNGGYELVLKRDNTTGEWKRP